MRLSHQLENVDEVLLARAIANDRITRRMVIWLKYPPHGEYVVWEWLLLLLWDTPEPNRNEIDERRAKEWKENKKTSLFQLCVLWKENDVTTECEWEKSHYIRLREVRVRMCLKERTVCMRLCWCFWCYFSLISFECIKFLCFLFVLFRALYPYGSFFVSLCHYSFFCSFLSHFELECVLDVSVCVLPGALLFGENNALSTFRLRFICTVRMFCHNHFWHSLDDGCSSLNDRSLLYLFLCPFVQFIHCDFYWWLLKS